MKIQSVNSIYQSDNYDNLKKKKQNDKDKKSIKKSNDEKENFDSFKSILNLKI